MPRPTRSRREQGSRAGRRQGRVIWLTARRPFTAAGQRRSRTGFPHRTGLSGPGPRSPHHPGLRATSAGAVGYGRPSTRSKTLTAGGRRRPCDAVEDAPPVTTSLHSVTWLVWAIAVTVSLQLARNPLLVAITLAVVWLVVETHRRPGSLSRAFPVVLAMAVIFGLLRVALIGLTTPLDPGRPPPPSSPSPRRPCPPPWAGSRSVARCRSRSCSRRRSTAWSWSASSAPSAPSTRWPRTTSCWAPRPAPSTSRGSCSPSPWPSCPRPSTPPPPPARPTGPAPAGPSSAGAAPCGWPSPCWRRGWSEPSAWPSRWTRGATGGSGPSRSTGSPWCCPASPWSAWPRRSWPSSGSPAGSPLRWRRSRWWPSWPPSCSRRRSAPTRYRARRLGRRDCASSWPASSSCRSCWPCARPSTCATCAWDPAVLPFHWPGLPLVPAVALVGLAVPAAVRPS